MLRGADVPLRGVLTPERRNQAAGAAHAKRETMAKARLTIKQAARALDVCEMSVRRWCKAARDGGESVFGDVELRRGGYMICRQEVEDLREAYTNWTFDDD